MKPVSGAVGIAFILSILANSLYTQWIFLFSRLFYHLYKEKKQEIQEIKEIQIFQPNEDLLRTLKSSPQKRLQYVAVEGLVQPDDEPLASPYVPRYFGVIQKVVMHEYCEVWNPSTVSWIRRKTNTKERMNTVPFSLVCPGL
ncbi:hypothetical protein AAFF_G00228380 [Aldrovandia affinis]|uniref:Uncharacterized protein n=1 Tax=Aldrovandia affinis TaxID=143900 RepID=A0AAD7WU79_9TELE|nr:hypothetical protein AAFF_G00228380 [Aldrovandia affinis]